MSAPVQKGLAVAWGITSTAYTCAGAALLVHATEQSLTRDAKMTESADPVTGATIGLVFFDSTQEVQLRVYPMKPIGTGALAAAAATAYQVPNIGDAFVVTDAADTAVAATTYVVVKVSRTRKVGDKVEFDITIKKWENDLSVTAA